MHMVVLRSATYGSNVRDRIGQGLGPITCHKAKVRLSARRIDVPV